MAVEEIDLQCQSLFHASISALTSLGVSGVSCCISASRVFHSVLARRQGQGSGIIMKDIALVSL